jgi:2,4-dienoyl-CoA reductase-like NADH-dependent reductase (Old Yellow Enzyme family)
MRNAMTAAEHEHSPLFDPIKLGQVPLDNRVALAPMTRVSATYTGAATDAMAAYYGRFAHGGFGLLITEGIYTDTTSSQGNLFQPGLALPEHTYSWKKVIDRVHASGSKIFAQLMHAGPQYQGSRYASVPIGPSAVRAKGEQLEMYRGSGPYPVPTEMTYRHITETIKGFTQAALRAREAGFDGVEIHGANGYLIDAFLTSYSNLRNDEYGGSTQNRVRFAVEVCEAVRAAVGPDTAVGIRVSQGKVSDNHHKWEGGIGDAEAIFTALGETGIDFIHTTEYRAMAPAFHGRSESLAALAKKFGQVAIIANGNLDDPSDATELIRTGTADIVAIGKPALANRDWPKKVFERERLEGDVDKSVFGPIANVKDWELEL